MDDKDKKRLTSSVGVKGNVRYITITDNMSEHWDALISIVKSSYTWYAYIYHEHDDTDKHIHILAYDEGGTTLKAHCKRFESVIPSNFVLKVFSPRAMARYLIHKDSPEKYQYNYTDIITNGKDKLAAFFKEDSGDVVELYRDFCKVQDGEMSVNQFLDKYRGDMASIPFHHKLGVMSRLRSGMYIK